ncbi:hypothetical protein [Candidatus Leptofilum sp.]|uniref:nSTAND1 domain-containing NTPase n=1 Tax=Candidatus Leptofilum sp. TaxID=3241576 RepID=UPI003B5B7815
MDFQLILKTLRHLSQQAENALVAATKKKSIEGRNLVSGLQHILAELEDQVRLTNESSRGQPYKGLLAHELSDTALFFGREEATAVLLEQLQNNRLTILHSESGVGKTSLLKASLTPHLLEAGHLPLYLRPYKQDPGQALKNSFRPRQALTTDIQPARPDQSVLTALRHIMSDRFSQDDLQNLAFDMGIDLDDLPAVTKSGRIRELILYCKRHGRIAELRQTAYALRPDLKALSENYLFDTAVLNNFLRQITEILGDDVTIYIFVDQFEEFFSQLEEPDRLPFVHQLADCLSDRSLNVHWLLSLRGEYLSQVSDLAPPLREPLANEYRLKHLRAAEAHKVITHPAAQFGIEYETGLVNDLVADLGQKVIVPAHLQWVCSALVDALPPGQTTITKQMYKAQGGTEGILAEHLDRFLKLKLPPGERVLTRQLLESLVTSDVRRVAQTEEALLTELTKADVTPQTVQALLQKLVNNRLVRRYDMAEMGLLYELAHDFLAERIELSDETVVRKQAEELLHQGLHNWQQLEILLSASALQIIGKQRDSLVLDDRALGLLLRSAASQGQNPAQWVQHMSLQGRQTFIRSFPTDHSLRLDEVAALWAVRSELPRSMKTAVYRQHLTYRALANKWWLLAALVGLFLGVQSLALIPPFQTDWRIVEAVPASITGGNSWVVAADAHDPNHVYLSDQTPGGLYQSLDGGLTWRTVGDSNLQDVAIRDVAVSDQTVYALSQEAIFVKMPASETWSRFEPQSLLEARAMLQAVALNPLIPDRVYITTLPAGLLMTQNGGQQWQPVDIQQMSAEAIYAVAADGQRLIVATDSGIWWREITDDAWFQKPLPEPDATITDLAIPSQSGRFYISTEGNRIYDADVAGEQYFSLFDAPLEMTAVSSLSVVNDAWYVVANSQLLCRRTWFWWQAEWWLGRLGRPVPCLGQPNTPNSLIQ